MPSSRGRGLRPGGVVRAIGRLVVLVGVGFALGVIFGVVTEEPELLASHLRGQSESVALEGAAEKPAVDGSDNASGTAATGLASADSPPGRTKPAEAVETNSHPLPSVASRPSRTPDAAGAAASAPLAAARLASDAAREARRSEVAVSTRREVPESARAIARGTTLVWSIQVGAFSDEAAAKQLAKTLSDRYPVVVLPAGGKGGRFRVRIQPIAGERLARETAEKLKRDERLPTWVTPVEGGSGS